MTSAKYLGYVGGAAVAVGVGAALATASQGTAHADTDTKSVSSEAKGPEKATAKGPEKVEKKSPGAKLEQRLNDAGVYHFWQIADLDAESTAALDAALNLRGRITRDNWIAAAKQLTEGQAA